MTKLTIDKKFPDTAKGAFECLCAISVISEQGLKVDGYRCQPDPAVEGVWKIYVQFADGKRWVVVLEMAGYKDPWGNIRESSDFSEGDADYDWHIDLVLPDGVWPSELEKLKPYGDGVKRFDGTEKDWENAVKKIWLDDGCMLFCYDINEDGEPVVTATYSYVKNDYGQPHFEVGAWFQNHGYGIIMDPRENMKQYQQVKDAR